MSKETGREIPVELNNGNLEFEYVYDLSGFFAHYDFISPTKIARRIGINTSLMRQYAMGNAYTYGCFILNGLIVEMAGVSSPPLRT